MPKIRELLNPLLKIYRKEVEVQVACGQPNGTLKIPETQNQLYVLTWSRYISVRVFVRILS